MANLFLKTAGGNYSSANTWSTTGAGGGDNSGPPAATTDAVAELLSGNVTIDAASVARSLDTTSGTGSYGGTITHNAFTLTIGDATSGAGNVALKLNAGITYTLANATTSAITFASTSATPQTITTAGKTLGNIVFNGSGGSFTLQDTLTITGDFTRTNGTFTHNNQTVAMTGAGSRTITGTSTFYKLQRTGTASKTDVLLLAAAQTVTNELILAGAADITRLDVQGSILNTQRTITNAGATMTWSNVNFRDIALGTAFDASAISGLSGDCGNNSNITFTTPSTQSPAGTGAFTFSTATWTTHMPLPQDTALINNAFSGSPAITIDIPSLPTMDFTGSSGTVSMATAGAFTYYGSFTLTSNVTLSGAGNGFMRSVNASTITMAGKSFAGQITIASRLSGSYTMQDAFSGNNVVTFQNSFTSQGFSVTGSTISVSGVTAGGFSTTTFTPTSTAATTVFTGGTSATLYATANVTLSASSTNTRTLALSTGTYGTITYTTAGSTGGLDFTGSPTIGGIVFSDITNARTLRFTAGTTITLKTAAAWQVNGTASKLMVVSSITGATHTISCASGIVSCDYVNFTNSIATGGATFYAGSHSVDNGGNTGWIFTDPPVVPTTPTGSRTRSIKGLLNLQQL